MRYTSIGNDPLSARRVSVLSLGGKQFGTMTDEVPQRAQMQRWRQLMSAQ